MTVKRWTRDVGAFQRTVKHTQAAFFWPGFFRQCRRLHRCRIFTRVIRQQLTQVCWICPSLISNNNLLRSFSYSYYLRQPQPTIVNAALTSLSKTSESLKKLEQTMSPLQWQHREPLHGQHLTVWFKAME